jgi:Ca2+-transporting ATPase
LTENATRTSIFITLIAANIFLTLANRSFYYSIFKTIWYKNNLVLLIIGMTILMTSLLLFIPVFAQFFLFEMIYVTQMGISVLIGFVSVMWIEVYKLYKRSKS